MNPSPRASVANLSESELVLRAARGDREAFTAILRRHNRMLFRTARSILRDDAEAEDTVQEAYLAAYRALPQFRAEARLSTWLVRITANQALARLRKRTRGAEVIHLEAEGETYGEGEAGSFPGENVASEEPGPEREAVRAETRRLIEAHIDRLPEAFRTVFILRELEEFSVEEVAASLDLPEATVRTRHFRAKGLLRESLSRSLDMSLPSAFSFDGARCDRMVATVLARLPAPPTGEHP